MTIYIGADHRGYRLKEYVKNYLAAEGRAIEDCGNAAEDAEDDYPEFAKAVAERVANEAGAKGIVICGSGNGVAIAANRTCGIRAAVALTAAQARTARSDEDANVIALAADYTEQDEARDIVEAFLSTPFLDAERHMRRIGKIE